MSKHGRLYYTDVHDRPENSSDMSVFTITAGWLYCWRTVANVGSCVAVADKPDLIFIARQHTHIDIANLSVCLSVRPSVAFRYQMKSA